MNLKIGISLKNAPDELAMALFARAEAIERAAQEMAPASVVERKARVTFQEPEAEVETEKPKKKKTTKKKAEAPENGSTASPAPAEPDGTWEPGGGEAVEQAEVSQATEESQADAAPLTLTDVRKRFTEIVAQHPKGRKKINDILIEAGATSITDLPEDKYTWALDTINTWAQEQSA